MLGPPEKQGMVSLQLTAWCVSSNTDYSCNFVLHWINSHWPANAHYKQQFDFATTVYSFYHMYVHTRSLFSYEKYTCVFILKTEINDCSRQILRQLYTD